MDSGLRQILGYSDEKKIQNLNTSFSSDDFDCVNLISKNCELDIECETSEIISDEAVRKE